MPDLSIGSALGEEELLAEADLWASGEMEQAFFSGQAEDVEGLPAAEEPPHKRRRKAAKLKHPPRKTALLQLKCLDGILQARLGHGLEAYVPDNSRPFPRIAPTLTLHTDEASSNISMACYLLYKLKARVLFTRDPHHRYWNDAKAALVATRQYWIVILARVVLRLPYGPWEGHGWWQKLTEQAEDSANTLQVNSSIWGEFYPMIVQISALHQLGTFGTRGLSCKRFSRKSPKPS